ncbi:MAG: hypothetical protein O7I93_07090 [Gemmatimonadetes bacterium]|nr:hypothetical protein [Gemmatimonadota bacterium]
MSQERTWITVALEVASSAFAVTVKMAAVLVGVVVTAVLFVGPACSCSTKASAYRAAIKSDLRNLVAAQEIYFSDSLRYAASLPELDFTASTYVTVELTLTSDSAWSASASHKGTPTQCTIFIGNIKPPVADGVEGEPGCHDPS